MLGLIAGIVQGAALIYEHWNGIGDFVRGELDKISKAEPFRFGVREQTTEEKKQREDSGWPSWLPHFSLKSATPEEKPAIAAPPGQPPEKSWWRSLFVTPANAAVPPAAAPSAPAVAAPQSTAAALPTAVPPVTVGADAKAITLDPTAVEALTRVAIAEAGNQGAVGLEGVVRTVLNRSAHPAWGGSIPDLVNQRGQFEPVMRAGGDWRNLPSGSGAQRATVQGILDGIASGRRTDPTGGATYFLNRDISERRGTDFGRGRDDLRSAEIGDHSFYKPGVFGEKPTPVPNYSVLLSDLAKAQAEQARAATANPGQPGQQGRNRGNRSRLTCASPALCRRERRRRCRASRTASSRQHASITPLPTLRGRDAQPQRLSGPWRRAGSRHQRRWSLGRRSGRVRRRRRAVAHPPSDRVVSGRALRRHRIGLGVWPPRRRP
ncbi:cell wall hydrolase [Azospirillum cavernae]|uniref:Cell wall hydrolase n=1 Tax=Azospirillum cavernae TaxID=2320860 RepID=A0A418W4U7_9PROT|nr:cell wall hydrolase [Azospirillum cavernae]